MNLQDGLNINKYLNVIDTDTVDTNLLKQKVNGRGLGDILEIVKVQASNVGYEDQFGTSIACSNTKIVVGAKYEDTTAANAGSAYIFDINGNELKQIQASNAGSEDQFGYSVAVSNTRIVVGAPGEDSIAAAAGSAYIFDLDGNEIKRIQASNAGGSDYFGWSVSCSDNRIVVGAYNEDSTATDAGSVYIFDINGNEIKRIQASDPGGSDYFGWSVAVSDTRIVVGAYGEDSTASNAGSAYIFDINGNQIAKIQASDAQGDDQFGYAVACSENRIVVGARYEDTGGYAAGSAYIFDLNGNELAKIQASDTEASDYFGFSVSCSDTRIVVGAYGEDTTFSSAGSVYIFDIHGNQISKIQASDAETSDYFGHSVACSDNRIVVGAWSEDTIASNAGAAYIFDQKLLPSTTSDIAGTQEEGVTYANIIDEVYNII